MYVCKFTCIFILLFLFLLFISAAQRRRSQLVYVPKLVGLYSKSSPADKNEARRKDSSASPLSFALLNAQIGQDPRASAEIENNKNNLRP